jgi:hypothetical protein
MPVIMEDRCPLQLPATRPTQIKGTIFSDCRDVAALARKTTNPTIASRHSVSHIRAARRLVPKTEKTLAIV